MQLILCTISKMMKLRQLLILFLCFLIVPLIWAKEEKSIEDITHELHTLKKILKTQNEKIVHLEGLLEKVSQAIEIEKPAIHEKITFVPSRKKKKINIGGELELEFKTSEIDRHPHAIRLFDGGHQQTFDMDKADIYMQAIWNDNLWTYFAIEFSENSAHIDTAYAQFDLQKDDENSFFIRAGLDHQFTKYSRTTETYPISGSAFWRDEFSQVRFHGNHSFGGGNKWLYWDAMLGNSYNVDNTDSTLSENPIKANEIMQDDNDFQRDNDNHLQWGFGLGITPDIGSLGSLDFRIWYINATINVDEVKSGHNMIIGEFFDDNGISHPTTNNTEKAQVGLRVIYSKKFNNVGLKSIFEYINAQDGFIDRDSWYNELSLQFKLPGTALFRNEVWFTEIQPFIRFEEYDVDDRYDNQLAAPVTWDRQRWLLGANLSLNKLTKLRFEYLYNKEQIDHQWGSRLYNAPIRDIANSEFLTQLELKF